MMKVSVKYTEKKDEILMYKKLNSDFDDIKINKILNKKQIKEIQDLLEEIHISDNIFEYVADIIEYTRN
jgi:MoxR-like ATPase